MCVGENTTKTDRAQNSDSHVPSRLLECPHTMKVLSQNRYKLKQFN